MRITAVRGAAKKAGVRSGENLISINGHGISDVLDYRFYSYEPRLRLRLRTEGGIERELTLKHREGDDPGLYFENYLMDTERRCQNHCIFCFIDQNPQGCRESLYFKDDDARLSFLLGNYITLTNLSEEEIERICRFRLSPLGISIHTTDPALRVRMLCNPKAAGGYETMRRFARAGIFLNAQIVLCPGYNDKDALDATLADLCALGEQLISVSVVPVGLTRHRDGLPPLRAVNAALAADTIERCARWNKVYCGDELYLRAGLPLPPAGYYRDFPQLQNGVGLMALFLDEWEALPPLTGPVLPQSLATGMAAYPFFCSLLEGLPVQVYGVENRFFGSTVDVAGLLTGGDLLYALRGKELGKRLLIPRTMLRHGGNCFLDDMTLPELSAALGTEACAIKPTAETLWDALTDQSI